MSEQPEIQTTCKACGHTFAAMQHAKRIPASELGVVEVGIHCPECKTWYPAYFTTQELDDKREHLLKLAKRADIRFGHFQKQLTTAHDALQARFTKNVRVLDV